MLEGAQWRQGFVHHKWGLILQIALQLCKIKMQSGHLCIFYKGINAHFPMSVCVFQSSVFGIVVFMLMCVRKLALFTIWKVSSAILCPIGRKPHVWLRQSAAGAQPWLLIGCYMPSQTSSKFLGCGIGIEFGRSKHLPMQWTFLFSLVQPLHLPTTIRIWKIPGHKGQ